MKYSKFESDNESPGLSFWQVSTLWQRKIKEALRSHDITHTQFVILAVTHELNGKGSDVTQKEISDYSMIDVMTVSTTLRLLEKKNLVIRGDHSSDTRAKRIKNTEHGEKTLQMINPIVERVDAEFFFDDEKDLSVFMNLLRDLKNKDLGL